MFKEFCFLIISHIPHPQLSHEQQLPKIDATQEGLKYKYLDKCQTSTDHLSVELARPSEQKME